jgi:hypothetical protein
VAAYTTQSLTDFTSLLNPAVLAAKDLQIAPTIIDFKLYTDFISDSLILSVQHKFFDRSELLDNLHKRQCAERLYKILQVKQKTPKQITVERRRLLWRGEQARKNKVRRK